jgi:hypothetical protein
LRNIIKVALQFYRENPAAFTFVLLRLPSFTLDLPPDAVYPVEIIEAIVGEGQKEGSICEGQPNLVAAIFLGCLLRPIIVAIGAAPGALNLLEETRHDQVIEAAALRAIVLA